tara:strand:+ start:581 stop:1024 length:444 start_codon:yes stop_codon:yes gene_type:complete
MNILFREFDPFNCWIWIKFFEIPNEAEKNYLRQFLDSWYTIGTLGGFNSENLQTHEEGADLSWMSYDNDRNKEAMPAFLHNVGEMEYQDVWSRFWVDFGTSDSISLDILINSLNEISNKYVKIDELIIGGENSEWAIEEPEDLVFKI